MKLHYLAKIKLILLLLMSCVSFVTSPVTSAESLSSQSKPKIGIIGAGWLGGTVGKAWIRSGYQVMFSTRHPDKLQSMVTQLGAKASLGTPREAAAFGDIILIAVPYSSIEQISRDFEPELKGKIILDATNAHDGPDQASKDAVDHGVAVTSAKYFKYARLVRAFSAVDATAIEASSLRNSHKLGVPLASDDPQAMAIAKKLVIDAGCTPVIVGDLSKAHMFERGNPGFRANTTAPVLREILGLADD
ncbi:NADPH-dependent F420 reductase [Celerinatantimonas sp. YJH-8]|uniref:NADPH-dependent F420 reductase n=1 Tax=Celerinatantimonas sp. YJH-8 TaxID=3228714 RepID=UPI0038BEE188